MILTRNVSRPAIIHADPNRDKIAVVIYLIIEALLSALPPKTLPVRITFTDSELYCKVQQLVTNCYVRW